MLFTSILGYILLWSFLIGLIALTVALFVWALRGVVTATRKETEPLFRFSKEEDE